MLSEASKEDAHKYGRSSDPAPQDSAPVKQAVANQTYRIMGSYVAAVAWYLIICSILMVGQSYLEKRFGRGFGTTSNQRRAGFLSFKGGAGGA